MQPAGFLAIDDLATAFIEYDEYKGYNTEFESYYGKKLQLLKRLFECDIEKRAQELDREFRARMVRNRSRRGRAAYEVNGSLTVTFLEISIRAVNQAKNPFREFGGGLIAGMPPKVVRRGLKSHCCMKKGSREKSPIFAIFSDV